MGFYCVLSIFMYRSVSSGRVYVVLFVMFLFSEFNFRTSIVRSFVCFVINILIAFNKVQFMGHLWHIRG